MRAYLIQRLFAMIPTVIGITIITFLIIQLSPGHPAMIKIQMAQSGQTDPQVTAAVIEQTKELYGLDKPLPVQYLIWFKRVVTLNFGESFIDHRPVRDKIVERIPVSLQLSLISLFLVYLIAVPLGIFSAARKNTKADRGITLALFIAYSMPHFWVAMILIIFLGGGKFLSWFPIYGLSSDGAAEFTFWQWLFDRIHHLVLPVFCLTYGGLAYISRQMRGAMLEVIRQDYIRTAQAKGLSELAVVLKHALRNSLIPIITLLAHLFPALIGGSVIIEQIFSIPGMGQLSFQAILTRDYPLIMGVTTVAALLTLVGILFSDIIYTLVDPRITFDNAPLLIKPRRFLIGLAAVAGAVSILLMVPLPEDFGVATIIIQYGPRLAAFLIAALAVYMAVVLAGERSYWRIVFSQFFRNRLAVIALTGLGLLLLVAIFAPLIANHKPLLIHYQGKYFFPAAQDLLPQRLRKHYREFNLLEIDEVLESLSAPDYAIMPAIPFRYDTINLDHFLAPPSSRHWLGTDDSGRDVAARVIYGTRIALSVGVVAVGIYVFIGILLGSLAGYYGGWVDMLVSRLIEVMLSIPTFFLIIAVVAFLKPSIYNVMAAIGLVGWTGTARLVRGEFLKLRNQDFIEASHALGAKSARIIFRHALPNALTPVLVVATFGMADAILIESSLSFLGFGVQPPTPSWGDILKVSNFEHQAWWLAIFPGVAIFFTVTMLNLAGEGLRDAIDPRLKDTR